MQPLLSEDIKCVVERVISCKCAPCVGFWSRNVQMFSSSSIPKCRVFDEVFRLIFMIFFLFHLAVFDSTEEEAWAPSSSSTFGGWEAHTRGIGSKLMMKMGYEYGKGKHKCQTWLSM